MLRGRGGSERGSVAITVTLSLTLLLGLAALVVDVGLNWAARTSAQTAADSAALAGASQLVVGGQAAAVTVIDDLLKDNLVIPDDPNWAFDGDEDNGEVLCWTLPDPPPSPPVPAALRCPPQSNALRVITPPVKVQYAFAPVLGKRSNAIKAMAAAGAGPAAPNNCVLCVLDPAAPDALRLTGTGGIEAAGGGIVVNSESGSALNLLGSGTINAPQIRVLGGITPLSRLPQLLVQPERGGPPAVDPLADLLPPNRLIPAPPLRNTAEVIDGDRTLQPGVYDSIDVRSGTLTLAAGVYVVTDFTSFADVAGFTVRSTGRVVGNGATIYLACASYPAPCSGGGATFRLEPGGQFLASPPTAGDPYAGVSIFSDRGNTRTIQLLGPVELDGAVYAASARLRVDSLGAVQVHSLVAVDRLRVVNVGSLRVDYAPTLPLIAVGRPVLIR
jgi:Putative Flp pilus-assembly TadE/G-like